MNDKPQSLRERIHEIVFEADTPAGKLFDVALIWSIVLSVVIVMLDSVRWISEHWDFELTLLEWIFTIGFSAEYILRVVTIRKPLKYVFSFYGIVDLLAVLPTYISLVVPGSQFLLVVRVLRLLRVFRVLKLVQYLSEAQQLTNALRASARKIFVFIFAVSLLTVIFGSVMYVVEGEANGFTSIPKSIYWAIVTMTTVGYGDISPQTPLGQAIASFIMILGYGIIAVPTGIVTAQLSRKEGAHITTRNCIHCGEEGHDVHAEYCKMCGGKL